jgi:hypothetical protein
MKSPTARQEATRRRLAVACAMVGLALASGVIGTLTHTPSEAFKSSTGPFSYIPID